MRKGAINLGSPVSNHPLNRGLVVWWLALNQGPGFGTQRFLDLLRRNHGSFVSGPTWRSNRRRTHGWGCVDAAGGTEKIQVQATNLPTGSTAAWTFQFWHCTRSYVSLSHAFGFGDQLPVGGGPTGTGRYVLQFNAGAGNNYYFWGFDRDWDTTIAWDVDSVWHQAAFVSTGSDLLFYRDGVLRASRGSLPAFLTSGAWITAFSEHTSAVSSAQMSLDDCAIWNRALSASEVYARYQQAQRNYPDLLSRISRPAIDVPAAPAGTILPLVNHYMMG